MEKKIWNIGTNVFVCVVGTLFRATKISIQCTKCFSITIADTFTDRTIIFSNDFTKQRAKCQSES